MPMFPVVRTSLTLVGLLAVFAEGRPEAGRVADVTALVTLVAEGGAPIRDLTAKDFVVKEGGKKLEVVEAQVATDPLSVALMLDTAQPARGSSPPTRELRVGATAFVTTVHGVNPDAQIALWEVASAALERVPFTSKSDDLTAALEKLYSNQQTGAVLIEAADKAGRQLSSRRTRRRALVTVDFTSPEASTDGMLQQAGDSIASSGATFWAVSVRGVGATNPNREELLDQMTKATGGKRYVSSDNTALEGMLKKVAASLTSQYLVTFTRTGDGKKPITFETVKGPKVLLTPFMQ
jgi:VWFA-related protein